VTLEDCAHINLAQHSEAVVDAAKYRSLRETLNVQLHFQRPIFDWTGVIPKFFKMIFTAVGAKIPVNPKEFSAVASNNVGEVQGRYSVYGGSSAISIFADRLSAEFPLLTPVDYPLVRTLLETVHDSFMSEFSDVPIASVEYSSADHIEILPPHTVKEFLAAHRCVAVEETFKDEAVYQPGIKFNLKGTGRPWEYSVVAEQSLLHAAALFVSHTLILNDAAKLPTFRDKVELGYHVEQMALKALKLERADDPSA
jgi:hypothetical protein